MSIDSVHANKAFAAKLGLPFPLVGDPNRTFTRQAGVLLPQVSGINDVTYRAVIVVDSRGTVRWRWGADTQTQPDPMAALEQVRRIAEES